MTNQSLRASVTGCDAGLLPGFADPVFDAQAVFRAALLATAYPGRIVPIGSQASAPAPLDIATAALALTLFDFETPVWLDDAAPDGSARAWLAFHCGAPVVQAPRGARFAIVTDPAMLPPLADFNLSDSEYPDRSTTLIVQVPSFVDGPGTVWRGPGIRETAIVAIAGLPATFWADWALNREVYPAGIDVFLTCGNAVVGLPRTIEVEV